MIEKNSKQLTQENLITTQSTNAEERSNGTNSNANIRLETLSFHELLKLSNNQLKSQLERARLPIGKNKKIFMVFKLMKYYRNIQYIFA